MMNVTFDKDDIAQVLKSLWSIEKEITDADVDLVNRLAKKQNVFTHRQLFDLFFFYVRIDSKTNDLLTEGHWLFDGEAIFADEQDALEFVNEQLKSGRYQDNFDSDVDSTKIVYSSIDDFYADFPTTCSFPSKYFIFFHADY